MGAAINVICLLTLRGKIIVPDGDVVIPFGRPASVTEIEPLNPLFALASISTGALVVPGCKAIEPGDAVKTKSGAVCD